MSNPIARELDDFWQESQSLMQQWWVAADLDLKMTVGQQDYWNQKYGIQNYRNQKMLQFNKILRIINMIGGYQRDGRLATIVSPADNDPDTGETADQLSTVLNWCMKQDGTYEKISGCFDGSNICGLNLLHLWMDFREDPENGELKTTRIPFNAFLTSPYWEKPDLSDCERVWTRKYLTRDQLLSLYPKLRKDLPFLNKGYASKDGKFQFLAQNWQQYNQNIYAYDEYWVRDYKTTRKIVDRQTGEVAEWKGTKDQFQILRRFNPNAELIKATVPSIKLHCLVNNHVVYEEKAPYGLDRLPFVPFVCYHFPEIQDYSYRYQGVVRNIIDSQVELNKRRNRLLDIMDAQVQSGIMVKEDALVNPEDAFMQGPGKVMYFKNSANLQTDVAPIPPPPVAQGWMELIQTIEKEIMDIVGPEELFAQNMGAKDMTSALMKLKMGAGLVGLRNIFDNLNQAQMFVGDIQLDMIQKNFGEGKIQSILGKKPTAEFSQFWKTKYHCVTEEGELTSTQRQLQFIQAVQLKPILNDPNAISDDYLIQQSTIKGKKELVEGTKQRQQAAEQMQQAQAMQQMEQNRVMTRSLEAKAQSDFSSAKEKDTRSLANIGLLHERDAQALHDRASTALDNAKALKELDEMDEDRLIKLSKFILDMQAQQQLLEGQESALNEELQVSGTAINAEQQTQPQSPQAMGQ